MVAIYPDSVFLVCFQINYSNSDLHNFCTSCNHSSCKIPQPSH